MAFSFSQNCGKPMLSKELFKPLSSFDMFSDRLRRKLGKI